MMTRDELYSYCKIFIRLVKMTAGPKTSHEKGGEYVWKRNEIAVARDFFNPLLSLDSAFTWNVPKKEIWSANHYLWFSILLFCPHLCSKILSKTNLICEAALPSSSFSTRDNTCLCLSSLKVNSFEVFLQKTGWQKLRGSTGGTRRKVWTWTKILGPNIRYFVAN